MAVSIIPFPKRSEANFSEVESLIRKWLAEMSASSDATEYIADRMMLFIDKYASKTFEPIIDLPAPKNLSREEAEAILSSIEKGIDHTAQEVQDMINRIIIERLYLELEIYESRSPRGGFFKK